MDAGSKKGKRFFNCLELFNIFLGQMRERGRGGAMVMLSTEFRAFKGKNSILRLPLSDTIV